MTGIFFAAGKGSRMQTFTDHTPKPLAKVQGKTLLERNMANLAPFVDKFIIVISWLGEKIQDSIGDNFMGKKVEYVWQINPKGGTLDAFRAAIYSNLENQKTNYWVANSDEIHGSDIFEKFYKSITEKPDLALVSAKIMNDPERLKNFGVYEISENYDFINVVEHPQEYVSNLVNTGIYYFPNKVIEFITKEPNLEGSEHLITNHLFNPYSKKYPIKVVATEDLWFPISSLEDLAKAENIILG
jgi:UDP-N-acetylglucosamine diphosphorylase / glucose-1-phosphate thymidylyltransferase / UDP-N-acetylgalactosamine diphosphorylase / glucosamine-1-phosphate N-acetyltransferase / galactosamine-1-phosphate N-acetyltransferase